MSALTKEDWMFDRLLESAPLSTIRICRLYEYAREVTVWPKNSLSLGEMAMLLSRPELITPLFGFCITKPGCSGDWLRKPYFKLSSRIRDDLDQLGSGPTPLGENSSFRDIPPFTGRAYAHKSTNRVWSA